MRGCHFAVAAVIATTAVMGTAQAVTDTVFNYSPARNGWLTINPADFVPDNSVGASYVISTSSIALTGPGNRCFLAGVHLPHAAKITQVGIWYLSNAGGSDLQFQLARTLLADGTTDFLAVKNAHDDSFTRKTAVVTVASTLATVNNAAYRYDFVVCPQTADNIFYGARINYTYANAGD